MTANHPCPVLGCTKTYTSRHGLTSHRRLKHGSKAQIKLNLPCKYLGCSKVFTSTQGRNAHVDSIHKKIIYHCTHPECSKTFSSDSGRQSHYKTIHENLKFPCTHPECSKTFRSDTGRSNHYRKIHENLTDRFPCPYDDCSKAYTARNSLSKHIQNFHKKIKFSCPYDGCGKEYANAKGRDEHVRFRHKEQQYVCHWQDCRSVFPNKNSLKLHEDTVHAVHVYNCQVDGCNFSVVDPVDMITHADLTHKDLQHEPWRMPWHFMKHFISQFHATGIEGVAENVSDEESDIEDYVDGTNFVAFRNEQWLSHHKQVVHGFCWDYVLGISSGQTCSSCPTILSLSTAVLRKRQRTIGGTVLLNTKCVDCISGQIAERREAIRNKDPRLCQRSLGCLNVKEKNYSLCKSHLEAITTRKVDEIIERPNQNQGVGSKINSPKSMTEHLDKYHIHASDMAKTTFRKIIANVSKNVTDMISKAKFNNNVYFIDTEFAGPILTEITVLDSVGRVIVSTLVDHGVTIRSMFEAVGCDRRIFYLALCKAYGPPADYRPEGLTANAIGRMLTAAGFNHDSYLLEWSNSRCDWHRLRSLLSVTEYGGIVPPESRSILCIPHWRFALPGLLSLKLGVIYKLLFPADRDLLMKAHTSLADAHMLKKVMEVFIKYAFHVHRPLQQGKITSFFQTR